MRVRGRYLDDYFANDGSASRDGASMAARFGSIFFTASFDRRGCSPPLFCREPVIGTEDESKNLFVRFQFSRKLEGRWKIRYIPRVKDFQINGNIDVTRRVRVIRARQFSSSSSSSC